MNLHKLFFITLLLTCSQLFASDAIYKASTEQAAQQVYKKVYEALEAEKFWVVFEADIGSNIARMKDRMGDAYNQNQLDSIQTMVVCNAWFANQVSNLDPDMLALCPLRLTITSKAGKTTVVFVRPTIAAQNSPALSYIQTLEDKIISAINKGVSAK